jgi:hypothetical protein
MSYSASNINEARQSACKIVSKKKLWNNTSCADSNHARGLSNLLMVVRPVTHNSYFCHSN